jgi:hypothetical protein
MTMGILSKAKTVGVPKCDLDYDVASCHPRRGNWFWRTIVRGASTDPRGVKLT